MLSQSTKQPCVVVRGTGSAIRDFGSPKLKMMTIINTEITFKILTKIRIEQQEISIIYKCILSKAVIIEHITIVFLFLFVYPFGSFGIGDKGKGLKGVSSL